MRASLAPRAPQCQASPTLTQHQGEPVPAPATAGVERTLDKAHSRCRNPQRPAQDIFPTM